MTLTLVDELLPEEVGEEIVAKAELPVGDNDEGKALRITFDPTVEKRSYMDTTNEVDGNVLTDSGISNLSSLGGGYIDERDILKTEAANYDDMKASTVLALPSDVQSSIRTPHRTKVTTNDIFKIFKDDTELAEVSIEELDRIRKMHRRIEEMALPSFNYNSMILVASILAGLGLVSNSVATIIASMLVSPLMGPVVGLAYGLTIYDWQLVLLSFKTECISLLFCIVIGMIIGSISGATELSDDWLTAEMKNRGTWENFIVGLPVAFFSGIGVAVSILDDQTSSLVGVAISASLLPPAVNCGVLFVAYIFVNHDIAASDGYDEYSDFREAGLISLFLTIANIILIIISSMIMFRMKEVLPIKKNVFWADLGIARKVYSRKAVIRRYNEDGAAVSVPLSAPSATGN